MRQGRERRCSGALAVAVAVMVVAPGAGAARYGAGDTGVVNVSRTPGFAEGEEPMSVDPRNPNRLVVVANQWQSTFPGPLNPFPGGNGAFNTAVWSSRDGGRTWTGGRLDQGGLGKVPNPLAPLTGSAPEFDDAANVINADADSAWDRRGNAYFESGDIHGIHHGGDEVATVWRSSDGGVNWQPPGGVTAVSAAAEHSELDRPWFAVDNSGGPRDGTVYMTFETTPFADIPPQVYVKRSTDQGRTWGPTVRVDAGIYETQFNARAKPVVGADGALYVVYDLAAPTVVTQPVQQVGPIHLAVARSTDGGQTFQRTVLDEDVHRVTDPDEALPNYTEMISAIATDPARPGRVAVAWPEASGSDSSRIVLRSSADGGRTWSPRVDVADDPSTRPNQHDHVTLTWLSDGRLVALWRDHRCCGGAFDSRYQEFARTLGPDASGRLAIKGPAVEFTDGPQARTTERRGSLMPDEFQGLVAGGGAVMASWAQVTGDFTDVVFRRVPLTAFGPPPASRANACGTVSRRRGRLAALVVGRRTARGVRLVPRHGRVYVRLCAPQTVRGLKLTLRGDRNRLFGRGRARRVSGRRTISIRLVRRFSSGTYRLAIVGRNPDGRVGRLTAQLLLTAPRQ